MMFQMMMICCFSAEPVRKNHKWNDTTYKIWDEAFNRLSTDQMIHIGDSVELARKGHYVRLWSKDDEENCGVSGICKDCFDKGITHHQYDYEPWEMDLNGDKSECHICKKDIY